MSDIRVRLSGSPLIMVANVWPGSGRTTAALALGSVLAKIRAEPVAIWDNDPINPELHERAEALPPHDGVPRLLAAGAMAAAEEPSRVAAFLGAQPGGAHVLAGATQHWPRPHVSDADCTRIGAALRRHYAMVVMDTGTEYDAPQWRWAVRAADALLIPMPVDRDAARAAAWMCEQLAQEGHAALVRSAVLVMTQRRGDVLAGDRRAIRAGIVRYFHERVAAIVGVPYERRLVAHGRVALSRSGHEVRRAWTAVAAAVVGQLTRRPEALGASARPAPAVRAEVALVQRS